MKTYIVEERINSHLNFIESITKNSEFILSYIPYQVERGKNEVTLRFTRYLLFSLKDKFRMEGIVNLKGMSTIILKSEKGNKFEIFISEKEDKEGKINVNVAIKYEGEKEWIVSKYLHEIAESLIDGIKKESEKAYEITTTANFSQNLSKLSFITKLLMKSRLIKADELDIAKGQIVPIITDLIQQYLRYQLIYISGVSTYESFRLLFVNGELKGTYVNIEGQEGFKEEDLNKISGHFKINIYVALEPKAILEGTENESS
ncbi:hypothetical protein [Sulfurisphaera tokodaii]|uniref:Uncharacterized protein n=2 Tax=Sulfurisphaera tokodaii TaxID=111955 RepID=Q96YJ4_SULTO|nr:hypothetical protein [Sulfurisphaera tokodaii]BAB67283.1 hypothetical protein STK_21780 [Sulfurisphaera tokodaii str. 7]HII73013.1 hypothetical protein [Sulfurisphaera tokodaii]